MARSLKISAFEVIMALGLMAIIRAYSGLLFNAWLINPALIKGELIAAYAVIAMSSEAVIVATFRPGKEHIFCINLIVAGIVTVPGWSEPRYLKSLLAVGAVTAVLRILVALVSLRASEAKVRRFTSALIGVPLLLGTVWTGFNLGEQIYYSYYFFPKFKAGYIIPTRWQDCLALGLLWGGTILLLYVSYRLLKYALRAV